MNQFRASSLFREAVEDLSIHRHLPRPQFERQVRYYVEDHIRPQIRTLWNGSSFDTLLPATVKTQEEAERREVKGSYTYGAKKLSPEVVIRLKDQFSSNEGSLCSICMDSVADKDLAIFACGHVMCMECFESNLKSRFNLGPSAMSECPHCRQHIDPREATTKEYFMKVHCPQQSVQPGLHPVRAVSGDEFEEL